MTLDNLLISSEISLYDTESHFFMISRNGYMKDYS